MIGGDTALFAAQADRPGNAGPFDVTVKQVSLHGVEFTELHTTLRPAPGK